MRCLRCSPIVVLVAVYATAGISICAADDAATAASSKVVAWNNLGMHCLDDQFSVFSLLPPYNTVFAQVIRNGERVTDPTGITVTYEAIADPQGSINTSSIGKTDFWQHVAELYGTALPPDHGLAGFAMPGAPNDPKSMTYDAELALFKAEGIPITPYDDAGHKNYYPMMRVTARDGGGVIASVDVVLPVSDELTCVACHGSSSSSNAAKPQAGWENDADPIRDYRLNILQLHDEQHAFDPLYAAALGANGYNSAGLHANAVNDGAAVLCAACHATNALPGSGYSGVPALTSALHGLHADVVDPFNGMTLGQSENRAACYRCHPGAETRCLRGAMGAAVAKDGTLEMQCQSCHGGMSVVGDPSRDGWLDEPACQQCHTGNAVTNSGKIRFTSAFDDAGDPRVAADDTFATNANTPAAGYSLYQFSKGHGGLACSACHGSTHAIFPSIHDNDNVASVQIQGHAGTIAECSACHGSSPKTVTGGPHGMHPVGQAWVKDHADAAEGEDESPGPAAVKSDCRVCHGKTYKGTVLSRALGDRTLSTEFGTKHFWPGFQVSCYACHNGPDSESKTNNTPAKVKDLSGATDDETPLAIKLKASDKDGDKLKLRIVSQPKHGTVALNGDVATLFPEPGYAGLVRFTYAAWDGKTDSNLGTVEVAVEDSVCAASVAPDLLRLDAGGGVRSVTLTLPIGCDWSATWSDPFAAWIALTSPSSGVGPGVLTVDVQPNSGDARAIELHVAGSTVKVKQGGTDSADLVGTFKAAVAKCTGSGSSLECKVKATVKVRNLGASKAKKSIVRFFLSADDVADAGDLLIGEVTIGGVKPGQAKKVKLSAKLAAGLDPAGSRVIATLDADNTVTEQSDSNNAVVSASL